MTQYQLRLVLAAILIASDGRTDKDYQRGLNWANDLIKYADKFGIKPQSEQ